MEIIMKNKAEHIAEIFIYSTDKMFISTDASCQAGIQLQ